MNLSAPVIFFNAHRGAEISLMTGSKVRDAHKRSCHQHTCFTSRKAASSTLSLCCIMNLYSWGSTKLLYATYSSNADDSAFETDLINRACLYFFLMLMLVSLSFEENRLKRNILFDLLDVQTFQCLYLITDCINSALLQTSVFYSITAWSPEVRLFLYLLFHLLIYLYYFLCS